MSDVETPGKPSILQESSKFDHQTNNNEQKPTNTAELNKEPGKLGTYASFFLLLVGIIASIIALSYSFNVNQDLSSCPAGFETSCGRVGVVMRISFALVAIFLINMIGTVIYTPFYDQGWLLKYLAFAGTCVGFYFASFDVFSDHGYAWFARIGGFIFLVLQKVSIYSKYSLNISLYFCVFLSYITVHICTYIQCAIIIGYITRFCHKMERGLGQQGPRGGWIW